MNQVSGSTLVQEMACHLFRTKPYLNQCWLIVNQTFRNKLQWNLNINTKFSFIDLYLKMSAKWRPFCPGSDKLINILLSCNMLQSLISCAFPVKLPSSEYRRSQHWLRLWLGGARHQAITWTNVDQVLRHLMASLGHNELTYLCSHWLHVGFKVIEKVMTLMEVGVLSMHERQQLQTKTNIN